MNSLIYPALLIIGFVGLAIMAAMGFVHGPGHHGDHGHAGDVNLGPGAHAHGDLPAGPHAAHPAPGHGHPPPAPSAENNHSGESAGGANALLRLMPFISPLNWFSWMMGAGAVGTIAGTLAHLGAPWVAACAVVGAIGFNLGVVKPVWKLVYSFTSKPAQGLTGCLLQQVEAVTSFNERGEGLVRVSIDGGSDDVLARLTQEELARGARVRRGDLLLIEEVDPQKNACRVSRV